MKNVLVTGGAGFLGSHLVDLLLDKGLKVRVIDNFSSGVKSNLKDHPSLTVLNQDILDIKTDHSIFKDVDILYHLAGKENQWKSIINPLEFQRVNVEGTARMLFAAKTNNIKQFLFASSASVYGVASTPTLEQDTPRAFDPSSLSKLQAETLAFQWGKFYDLRVKSLRIFNAYGPRCTGHSPFGNLFGVWMKQKEQSEPLTLFNNGNQSRDFVYCTDVANAFWILSQEGRRNTTFNIGQGKGVLLLDVAQQISQKIRRLPDRKRHSFTTWADISKIQFETTWSPKVPLEVGIKRSLEEIRSWENAPYFSEHDIVQVVAEWDRFVTKKKPI
jgi:UDP-glucose 4-epimerase